MAPSMPTLKDLIDACNAQANLSYNSWNDRRQYEWKMVIAIWTFIAVTGGFFVKEGLSKAMFFGNPMLLSLIMAFVATVLLGVWLYWLWRANEFDRQAQFHFQRESRLLMSGPPFATVTPFRYTEPKDPQFVRDHLGIRRFAHARAIWGYLVFTALLVFAVVMFVEGPFNRGSADELTNIKKMTGETNEAVKAVATKLESIEKSLATLREPRTQQPTRPPKREAVGH